MRSPSEERADAHIVSLEAQLAELEVAKKFEECVVSTERIEQMKKAQTDISRLKAQLEESRATRDFKACVEIQKQIDELKVCFSRAPVRILLSHMYAFLHPILCRPR